MEYLLISTKGDISLHSYYFSNVKLFCFFYNIIGAFFKEEGVVLLEIIIAIVILIIILKLL
jgi:hypothetical protein